MIPSCGFEELKETKKVSRQTYVVAAPEDSATWKQMA